MNIAAKIGVTSASVATKVTASLDKYDWTIPSAQATGSYTLTLTSLDGLVTGTSNFTVTAPTATTCTSWTYNTWGACSTAGTQTRAVATSLPAGCTGTPPASQTSQACTYVAQASASCTATTMNGYSVPAKDSGASVVVNKTTSITNGSSKTSTTFTCTNGAFTAGQETVVVTCSSGYFLSGTACVSPSITVVSPNVNQTFHNGDTVKIIWSSVGVDDKVYISWESFTSANVLNATVSIIDGTPASAGTYSWQIPANFVSGHPNAARMKILVSSTATNSSQGVSDVSDNYFSIAAPTASLNISQDNLASISDALAQIEVEIQTLINK